MPTTLDRFALTEERIDEIEAEALALLQRTGLRIESAEGLRALGAALPKTGGGAWLADGRIQFDPAYIRAFVADNLIKLGVEEPRDAGFRLGVCDMSQHYMQPGSDVYRPMSTADLIDATRFLDALHARDPRVQPSVPGIPCDVPMQLQALTEMMIGIQNSRFGGNIDTLHPAEAVPYLIRMIEAMGGRFDSIAMFTVSPMKLGGFEFEAALKYMDRCRMLHISSLPIPGMSAPIHLYPAWAVSIAEALGGAAVLALLSGGLPCHISVGMFPYDVRHAWVAGGTPEHALIEYHRSLITQRYDPSIEHSHSMTTSARRIGAQSGIEKAANAQFAALLGCRQFNTGGLLGFDDIFSPVQFLMDAELLSLIERNTAPALQPPRERWAGLIDEGVFGNFFEADETLFHYADALYIPHRTDRTPRSADIGNRADDRFLMRCIEEAENLIRDHKPPCARGTDEARAIYREAWTALGGGAVNPMAGQ